MKKLTVMLVAIAFIFTCIMPPQGFAQTISALGLMPEPGVMVAVGNFWTPAHLQGMVIHPTDPFKFDFIIHRGDAPLSDVEKQQEYSKLIKYFLAALAVPDTDQWVNLSPYEQDRIIPDNFGLTEMGRDLLAQDYLLKQISSSLTNPETDLGEKFWNAVYEQAYIKLGTTDIPTDMFNKIWITPDKATVYEKGNTVLVLKNHLKVMLESDYKAMQMNAVFENEDDEAVLISKQVMREVILPVIEKEVNEGKSFAPLRQVYSGMLLATWYKMALQESILGQLYANKGKVEGIDQDPSINQEIYNQYVVAFKKGVFNMIKEDFDQFTQEILPRKYFSGGATNGDYAQKIISTQDPAQAEDALKKVSNTSDIASIEVVNSSIQDQVQQLTQEKAIQVAYAVIQQVNGRVKMTEEDAQTYYVEDAYGHSTSWSTAVEDRLKPIVVKVFQEQGIEVTAKNLYGVLDHFSVLPYQGDPHTASIDMDIDNAPTEQTQREEMSTVNAVIDSIKGKVKMTEEDAQNYYAEAAYGYSTSWSAAVEDRLKSIVIKVFKEKGIAVTVKNLYGVLDRFSVIPYQGDPHTASIDIKNIPTEQTQREEIVTANAVIDAIKGSVKMSEEDAQTYYAQVAAYGHSPFWSAAVEDQLKRIAVKVFKEKGIAVTAKNLYGVLDRFSVIPYQGDPHTAIVSIKDAAEASQTLQEKIQDLMQSLVSEAESITIRVSDFQAILPVLDSLGLDNGLSLYAKSLSRIYDLRADINGIIDGKASDESVTITVGEFQRIAKALEDLQGFQDLTPPGLSPYGKQSSLSPDIYGGIDMSQSNLDMHIKRDGAGVPLPISQQNLDQIQINGLVPIILDIQPMAGSPILSQIMA